MWGPLFQRFWPIGFKWSTKLNFAPYKWDYKENAISEDIGKLHKATLIFGKITFCLISMWLPVRTYQAYTLRNESSESYYLIGCVMVIYSWLLVAFMVATTIIRHDFVQFCRLYITFANKFQERYFTKEERRRIKGNWREDRAGIICYVCYYLTIFIQVGILCIVISKPDLPVLLTSIEVIWNSPLPVYLAFKAVETFFICRYVLNFFGYLYTYGFFAVGMLFSVILILEESSLGRNTYCTTNNLRTEKEFLPICVQLYVLLQFVRMIYSPIILPAGKWALMLLCIFLIQASIKLQGVMVAVMFVGAAAIMIYLSMVFSKIAVIPSLSVNGIRSWKSQPVSLYARKKLMCFSAARINVGPFYYADAHMVLNMYRFMLESTFDLLVAD